MHKVKQMIDPPNCLACGRGNTVDHPMEEDEFWALDLERDINWGDNAYLCFSCVEQIAGFAGYVPEHVAEEKDTIIKKHLKTIHDLQSRLEVKERRLEQITTGLEVRKVEIKERGKTKAKAKRKAATKA